MQRRALITGATGFVGSHLVERLAADGWRLRALVRRTSDTTLLEQHGAELFRGDLGDREALREACEGVDVVFHLAAVTGLRGDKDFARANVRGTENVVEAVSTAHDRPNRFVYLSSYAACGPSDGQPRTLNETPAPLTAYGRTKLAGEEAVRMLEEHGVEAVVLRAPAVYGPGDHALLPYFRLVRWGLAPSPSGEIRRLHMVYAPDLARALARAAEAPPGTYPVAEPVEHTWDDVVRSIARAMDRRPLRVPLPPPLVRTAAAATEAIGTFAGRTVVFNREKAEEMLAPAWTCDLSRSEALLPAVDATPLEEGVRSTVRWYRTQGWL